MVIPHHLRFDLRVEQRRRALLVDVADQAAVDAVADQLAQARGEAARDLARDAELLVLLLADEAGAVVREAGFARLRSDKALADRLAEAFAEYLRARDASGATAPTSTPRTRT